jgi:hypothetical protein
MDLFCQKCDEPWDLYHVEHDMDLDDENGKARFKAGEGCPCCKWGKDAPEQKSLKGEAMGILSDLLGDDTDGMASMMDDLEYSGFFEDLDSGIHFH